MKKTMTCQLASFSYSNNNNTNKIITNTLTSRERQVKSIDCDLLDGEHFAPVEIISIQHSLKCLWVLTRC